MGWQAGWSLVFGCCMTHCDPLLVSVKSLKERDIYREREREGGGWRESWRESKRESKNGGRWGGREGEVERETGRERERHRERERERERGKRENYKLL